MRGSVRLRHLALGLLAVAGTAGPTVAGGLVVQDAGGRPVGIVLDPGGGSPLVAIESGGQLAVVQVGRDRFVSVGALVVFESTDCTGPPLLVDISALVPTVNLKPLFRPTGVTPDNVLLMATGAPPAVKNIQSAFNSPGCLTTSVSVPTLPATPFLDLGVFVPPFTAR